MQVCQNDDSKPPANWGIVYLQNMSKYLCSFGLMSGIEDGELYLAGQEFC